MERKNYQRLIRRKVFEKKITFEITKMDLDRVENIQKVGFGVDISSEGVGLTTDYALKKDDVLKLYLPVNEVNTNMPVFAKVVWSKQADNNFRAGLMVLG